MTDDSMRNNNAVGRLKAEAQRMGERLKNIVTRAENAMRLTSVQFPELTAAAQQDITRRINEAFKKTQKRWLQNDDGLIQVVSDTFFVHIGTYIRDDRRQLDAKARFEQLLRGPLV